MRTLAPATGFLGAPIETDLDRINARVAFLGVPHGWPYPDPGATAGCAEAPAAIRARARRLAVFRGHWDFDLEAPLDLDHLVDAGDVPGSPADGAGNGERATAAVAALLDREVVPVCVGGDDSIPIPVLRAYAGHGGLTILHVDAHLDFRDDVRGIREGYSSPMRRASEMEHVDRIVHVGLRGVGSARTSDVEDSRAAGNALVPAHQVHHAGIGPVLAELSDAASVFVSFDLDGLDPAVAPGVSAPAPGGLTYAHAVGLLRGVGPRLVGAAFTELVPSLDIGERTALTAVRLATIAACVV